MAEQQPPAQVPQPGEDWRAYDMTPFGPGAITVLFRVIEVVQDLHRRQVVRYVQVYPGRVDEPREMRLDAFVGGYFAPYEDESAWRKKPGWVGGAVSGEQPDQRSST